MPMRNPFLEVDHISKPSPGDCLLMNELPGVSIVIPNYNYQRYVGAAIESALAQNHPDLDVIVVDDGSSDNSRAVIASFGERIRAVYQANGGHVAACNAGWPLARHEIVIFLDADDLLMPDAASTIAAAWRPGVSKVQWTLKVVDAVGRPTGSSFPKYPPCFKPGAVRQTLLETGGYPSPPTSGNAYARSFLETLSPIEGHRWMDPLLVSAAPLYGDVITIKRVLSAYRSHDANGTEHSVVTTSRFERYVADEEARIAYLERCCKVYAAPFDAASALSRNVWYQEAQLVATKLGGVRSSLPAGWRTIRAILRSPQSLWHRSIRAVWIALIVLLPLAAARKLIELRFVLVRRPRFIEGVVRVFDRWQGGTPDHRPEAEGRTP
jgi:glycosyltransferase involved in cell wall biosynthesis